MTHAPRRFTLLLALIPALALAACNAPNPDDYGGGAKGEAIAKCITKTERADSSVTREQAGELCTCVTDKTYAALTGGGMQKASMERAFIGCAKKAGVEITD
ncbi:hypothetical protein [Erythrobacter sp. YT30]|uniref:hypothetical protein n=1 Tax=Erythrobacter sp. YT30 TaxID=1735012 RepID=UPI00076D6CB4|nr:hypothetical protein [Erythrobacter sp. YT30]KWV93272.1 hypothetical protein AUC45_03935 [Erythrobacter sp. YT30]